MVTRCPRRTFYRTITLLCRSLARNTTGRVPVPISGGDVDQCHEDAGTASTTRYRYHIRAKQVAHARSTTSALSSPMFSATEQLKERDLIGSDLKSLATVSGRLDKDYPCLASHDLFCHVNQAADDQASLGVALNYRVCRLCTCGDRLHFPPHPEFQTRLAEQCRTARRGIAGPTWQIICADLLGGLTFSWQTGTGKMLTLVICHAESTLFHVALVPLRLAPSFRRHVVPNQMSKRPALRRRQHSSCEIAEITTPSHPVEPKSKVAP